MRTIRHLTWWVGVAAALGIGLGSGDARALSGADCNGDGSIAINELILAVGIALGTQPLGHCAAASPDAQSGRTGSASSRAFFAHRRDSKRSGVAARGHLKT